MSEVILGTQANGTCHTCGKLSIELVPHDGRADFVLVLKGKCHSQTVGRNGPAVIRSSSTSRFVAKKRVVFDFERGFRAGPAVVSVTTELDVDGIGSTLPGLRGRIVQAVAERRTSETHDLAEQISNRLTKEHIIAEFDRHVDRQLDRLVQRPLFVQFSLPSAGMGGLPCCIRTTEDNIEICWGTSDSRAIRSLADKGLRRQGIVEVWLPFSWMGPEGERVFACWTSWRDLGRGIFAPGCSAPPIVELGGRTRFPRIAVTLFDRWMVVQVAPQAEVLDELRIVAATASTGQSTR